MFIKNIRSEDQKLQHCIVITPSCEQEDDSYQGSPYWSFLVIVFASLKYHLWPLGIFLLACVSEVVRFFFCLFVYSHLE